MKQLVDKKNSERTFAVGDWMYLKFQPYRHTSVEFLINQRLSTKFYCPFLIIKKVGTVTYNLRFPTSASIHPTFHVSLLKKHHETPSPPSNLPNTHVHYDINVLQVVLEVRIIKRKNKAQVEWLMKQLLSNLGIYKVDCKHISFF